MCFACFEKGIVSGVRAPLMPTLRFKVFNPLCHRLLGSMRFLGLLDRPSNIFFGPGGCGASLAVLQIYLATQEVLGLLDPPSNSFFDPGGCGVSLTLVPIYVASQEVAGSP